MKNVHWRCSMIDVPEVRCIRLLSTWFEAPKFACQIRPIECTKCHRHSKSFCIKKLLKSISFLFGIFILKWITQWFAKQFKPGTSKFHWSYFNIWTSNFEVYKVGLQCKPYIVGPTCSQSGQWDQKSGQKCASKNWNSVHSVAENENFSLKSITAERKIHTNTKNVIVSEACKRNGDKRARKDGENVILGS